MTAIFISGGAAALLLCFPGPEASSRPWCVTDLRSVLDDEVLEALDLWAAEGLDTEQLLCLADLLDRRAREHPEFSARLRRTVLTDPEALAALDELADRLGQAGLEHGRQWCLARAAELTRCMGTEPVGTQQAQVHL